MENVSIPSELKKANPDLELLVKKLEIVPMRQETGFRLSKRRLTYVLTPESAVESYWIQDTHDSVRAGKEFIVVSLEHPEHHMTYFEIRYAPPSAKNKR